MYTMSWPPNVFHPDAINKSLDRRQPTLAYDRVRGRVRTGAQVCVSACDITRCPDSTRRHQLAITWVNCFFFLEFIYYASIITTGVLVRKAGFRTNYVDVNVQRIIKLRDCCSKMLQIHKFYKFAIHLNRGQYIIAYLINGH